MIIVGLTGGIGSGKSTITKHIKKKKIPVFDSDKEVNKLYLNKNKNLLNIVKKISKNTAISKKNKINKKILSNIVFENTKKLKLLERVIFKILKSKRKVFLKNNRKRRKKLVFLDAPLLFESRVSKECKYVILVKAPIKTRIARIIKRPGMTKEKAKKIISKQMSDKRKSKLADFVVQTSFGKWYTLRAVNKIIDEIKKHK